MHTLDARRTIRKLDVLFFLNSVLLGFVRFSFNIHCAALKETFHPIYAKIFITLKIFITRKENKFTTFIKEERF